MNRVSATSLVLVLGLSLSSPVLGGAIGVTVDGIGSNNGVGSTTYRPLLDNKPLIDGATDGVAVEYYIPLVDGDQVPGLPAGDPCTYGVTYGTYACGTAPDSGNGGVEMSMFLKFDPVSTADPSFLEIWFEDLDLANANDPVGFLETLEVFDSGGTSLTGLITDINSIFVTGDDDTQQLLSLDLGVLSFSPLWAELRFSASYTGYGTNTPEYLIASVTSVPEPATLALLGLGLAMIAMHRRRRVLNEAAPL